MRRTPAAPSLSHSGPARTLTTSPPTTHLSQAASHHGIPHHYDPEPPPAEVAAAAAPDVALECDYLGYSLKDASERKKGPKFHEVLEGDPPVPSTGVSFAALRGFVDRHDKWLGSQPPPTTGEVVQALIRPVVAASGLSCAFAELLAKKDPGCAAKANLFVTHAWQAPFTALFEALSLHVPPGQEASTFLWLDAFCWNQVDLRSSSRAWWMGTFAPAIAACGRTVVVLHPWDSPVALSRAWCLFEMTATLISPRASLAVAATAAEEQRLLSALSSPGFDAKVVALARAVDLRTSKSEVPEDSAGIRGAIAETIGGAALNSAVVERLRTWLADRAHKALSAMPQGSPERGCSALITNLALLLREQGKLEEAAALLREAHESRAKALGDAHEDTLGAATDLASALQADEKLEEARALYERVLEQRRAQTGAEAAEGLFRALEGLAGTFQEEGKLEEAGRAYAEAAESLERMLGPEHDTAIVAALAKTAFDMHKLGRVAEADEKISSLLDRMASQCALHSRNSSLSLLPLSFQLLPLSLRQRSRTAHFLSPRMQSAHPLSYPFSLHAPYPPQPVDGREAPDDPPGALRRRRRRARHGAVQGGVRVRESLHGRAHGAAWPAPLGHGRGRHDGRRVAPAARPPEGG